MVDLYGARVGQEFAPLSAVLAPNARFIVAGVWRDYVRQSGAIAMQPPVEAATFDLACERSEK